MDEQIDLRPYINALLRRWWIVVVSTVVLAGIGFGLSSLMTPRYRATALVAVTDIKTTVQFDPRFVTVDSDLPLRAYPELATSDDLLAQLLDEVGAGLGETETVRQVREILTAEPGSDPSLIRLSVEYEDPAQAQIVANTWAELFVSWVNDIYGDRNNDMYHLFEEQLATAEEELARADEALIEFQSRNRLTLIDNELLALGMIQTDLIAQEQAANTLLRDVERLRSQLSEQPGQPALTFADQLTALSLQLKTFNVETVPAFQFQGPTDLTTLSRPDQIALLTGLVTSLEDSLDAIGQDLAGIDPEVLSLQEEKQSLTSELGNLERVQHVASDTVTVLARKVEEERITSEELFSSVRMASEASLPRRPFAPAKTVIMVAAGMFGLFASALVFVLREWWRRAAA